jgi:phenylalanyl-tRNA synthetase beta chain
VLSQWRFSTCLAETLRFPYLCGHSNRATTMTISYNWLREYLPQPIEPEKLSKILTGVGLEVESLEKYESIKGGLKGLVVGEVLECTQHPNADKLKLTKVDIGEGTPLQVVCGANNVAVGQKVIVATVATTIYPTTGEPLTMKAAKIRGTESQGMICAEDEIGIGTDHAGIIVLPSTVKVGSAATDFFSIYEDWIYEIGLTPNRMDAMSHFGVAKDVCAYLSHHSNKDIRPISPFRNTFKVDSNALPIKVTIENKEACKRYAGVTITGVTVKESPVWLKNKLTAIGQRSINNIVDITNFILHETGQPLHAFDAQAIEGGEIIVKTLAEGRSFITLDEKERNLSATDLMICNATSAMCIAGVFGGLTSGVRDNTTSIFLESAWFNPTSIRKTSFKHGLRTEAAGRFEKGVDISNVVNVLKRAATLIKEVAGGEISSDVVDIYPDPINKTEVSIKYHYLKKLSGKNYHPDAIKRILTSLGFEIMKEGMDEMRLLVPFSKPDISLPADIVEEILRIDGLDNVEITGAVTITPANDENAAKEMLREKIAGYLVGQGFNEILTNSITNSQYFNEGVLAGSVKMINNLSVELDVMRPSMVETGLETIGYNINRKNSDLQFFEFGKTYHSNGVGDYNEPEHLALYLTGQPIANSWKGKGQQSDFYKAKGLADAILQLCGVSTFGFTKLKDDALSIEVHYEGQTLVTVAEISNNQLQSFNIKQPVFCVDFNWLALVSIAKNNKITYKEVAKFPPVQRDVAIVVDRSVTFELVANAVKKANLSKLKDIQLFDIFESDKLGSNKKSLAMSFTFLDEEKTLTDKEIDAMVSKIIQSFEKELGAEIRK